MCPPAETQRQVVVAEPEVETYNAGRSRGYVTDDDYDTDAESVADDQRNGRSDLVAENAVEETESSDGV